MENRIEDSERVNTGDQSAGRDIVQNFGDTIQYGGKKIPRYLTSPPFEPETVLGRQADLDTVSNKLWHENHLLLLMNGEGGIGKTTLAATYWLNNVKRYQHSAWLYADSGIQPALFSLASKVNVTFDAGISDDDRWETLLQQLANLNDPCLLVLDNANDPDDLRKHYKHLRQLRNFHVVLTTRVNELADAPIWKVRPLDRETATSLFTSHYPNLSQADTDLLPQVLVAVGYNTLVMDLLAKNLHDLNRLRTAYTLQHLLADLQQKGLLRVQAKAVQTLYGSTALRTAKPGDIVRAMYDLNQLSQPQTWLLSNLGVLPAESITYERLTELLAPADSELLDDSLLELHRKGWADWNDADKTVKVSPVVQAVVRDKNQQNLLTDCKELISTLTQVLTSPNHTQAMPYANLADSVINALQENVFELAYLRLMLGDFNKETGNFTKAIDLLVQASLGFDKIGHIENYAVCLERLGVINQALGKFEEAIGYFEQCRKLSEELHQSNPFSENLKNRLADSYEKLGSINQALGKFEEALSYFKKRHKLSEELHQSNPFSENLKNRLAISYSKLGDVNQALGKLEEALSYFEQCRKMSEELYQNNSRSESLKNGLGISYSKLGEINQALGKFEEALSYFEKQAELFDELYQSNPLSESLKNGLGISYSKLGEINQALGKFEEALSYFEKDLKLTGELYQSNPRSESLKNGLAISYSKLGDINQALGKLEEALGYFKKRSQLGEELYRSNPQSVNLYNGLGVSYAKLGDLYIIMSENEQARSYLVKAEKIWSVLCEQVGIPEHYKNLAEVRQILAALG